MEGFSVVNEGKINTRATNSALKGDFVIIANTANNVMSAINSGFVSKIVLNKDINFIENQVWTFTSTRTLDIDLNGFNINGSIAITTNDYNADEPQAVVSDKINIKLTNSKESGGKITGVMTSNVNYALFVEGNAEALTVTLENVALENLKTRRAIRAYQDKVPDMKLIEQVTEAGTYAPTGMGRQSPIIVAVTDKATRDRLSQLNAAVMGGENDPFYGAPVVLVVLADREVPTYLYDGALVMGNLLNAAHAVGLGSCWIHRAKEVFDSEEGKALLKEWGIEGNYEGIGNCILGYPAGDAPAPKPRKADYVRFVK